MKGLRDQVAIVTGGAQGIGRGIVERLADENVRVLAVDLNKDALVDLKSDLQVETLALDISEADAPAKIIGHCVQTFGGLTALVNNAGIGAAPSLHETSDDVLDRFLDINLRSNLRLTREALPVLRDSKGSVVNVASNLALSGFRKAAAYTATKGGIAALTRGLASDYGPEGIRVNAVAPGVVETPLTTERLQVPAFRRVVVDTMPLQKTGKPSDIAALVAFLISQDARMITGQVIAVDGGQSNSTFLSEDVLAL